MMASRRPLHLAYAALALLFLISLTYRLRDTFDRVDEMRHGAAFARLPFDVDLPQLAISGTRPESDRAGLQAGDVVVGVEGRPLRGLADLFVPRAGRTRLFYGDKGTKSASLFSLKMPSEPYCD